MSLSDPTAAAATAMEPTAVTAAGDVHARSGDPLWRATLLSGSALLGGLALVLADVGTAEGLGLVLAGLVAAAFVLLPQAATAFGSVPVLFTVLACAGLGGLGLVTLGLGLGLGSTGLAYGGGLLGLGVELVRRLLPLTVVAVAALSGIVLVADAARGRRGGTRRPAPWAQLTAAAGARQGFPWRAVAGVLLVVWAAYLALWLVAPIVGGSGQLQLLLLLAVLLVAVVGVGTPLLIGSVSRTEQAEAADAHDELRARFAAHLHDSVLQTLALVQRQAHDPAAVTRLARRQEHALRAWMAGETELLSETLVAGLRAAVASVEDEHDLAIEFSAVGDRVLDGGGEALIAAAREALRNAVRHGAGARVVVFAEITPQAVEVFVRDEGPGFDVDAVPAARRGIRDAIVGRMAAAGGSAVVDAEPGEGTEVALRLGGPGARP